MRRVNPFFKKAKLNCYTKKLKNSVPYWIKAKAKNRDIVVLNISHRRWHSGSAKI